MEIISLSWMPHMPSILLRYPNATILVDCALDVFSLASFLPYKIVNNDTAAWIRKSSSDKKRILTPGLTPINDCIFVDSKPEIHATSFDKIEPEKIDAVLVSNWKSLMALPFLTEKTKFQGAIYATDPTIQLGKLVIDEFLDMFECMDRDESTFNWKDRRAWNNFSNPPFTDPIEWQSLYSKAEMESCLAKIKSIYFRETFTINGIVKVTACSSGFSIGSCNWIIKTEVEKIGFIAATSSRSSHTKEMDYKSLRNLDVMVMSSMSRWPEASPDSTVFRISQTIIETLKRNGNVIFPIAPTGLIYDLFELVQMSIEQGNLSREIPIYFISKSAQATLAYSNIYSEWLCAEKSAKACIPEEPFSHSELVKGGRIRIYENMHGSFSRDLRTPCVVFTGHPSLRFGEVVQFLDLWGMDQKSSIIMTDPDYPIKPFYDPYKSLHIRAYYLPIDTQLDFGQVVPTVQELAPKLLIIPEEYASPEAYALYKHSYGYTKNNELAINTKNVDRKFAMEYGTQLTYSHRNSVNLSYNQRRKRVLVDPDILKSITVQEKSGLGLCMVGGFISAYDNDLKLLPTKVSKKVKGEQRKTINKMHVYGRITPEALIKKLNERKIGTHFDGDATKTTTTQIIKIPSFNAEISIGGEGFRTKISCSDSGHRATLQTAIRDCLKST